VPRPAKIKTVLYLRDDQMEDLRKLAQRLDRSASSLIRDGVDLILKQFKKLR
jgi:hypothetical protein